MVVNSHPLYQLSYRGTRLPNSMSKISDTALGHCRQKVAAGYSKAVLPMPELRKHALNLRGPDEGKREGARAAIEPALGDSRSWRGEFRILLDWQNILKFHCSRVQSQAFVEPPMFSFSLAKYMHDYTGITHVPGRGWVPPHGPDAAHPYSASLIAAISHGFRLPYPIIDSIAVPTAP